MEGTPPSSTSTSSTEDGRKPRKIVMCFDGSGNMFTNVTNVGRLFRALQKNDDTQIVYYQNGIGTYYGSQSFLSSQLRSVWNFIDFAIALELDKHVKEGYQFIVHYYKPGDKICLFGFSRGAHTARVLAGMLYKVGVAKYYDPSYIELAFRAYMTTGYEGYLLSRDFRQTFSNKVTVEFLGCWDTVASVGLIPAALPCTSVNYAVKTFRHALALDERRTRFRPGLWSELTKEQEHDLDLEILEPDSELPDDRRDWTYKPPPRRRADVKEVWFAGTHADVGGGSHSDQRATSLSFISLRWMIQECFLARTGILFDTKYLDETLGFSFSNLVLEAQRLNIHLDAALELELEAYSAVQKLDYAKPGSASSLTTVKLLKDRNAVYDVMSRSFLDATDETFDQLVKAGWLLLVLYWVLDYLPSIFSYQDERGNWTRYFTCNHGFGRFIPYHNNKIYIHSSVRVRMKEGVEGKPYTPKACNWDQVLKSTDMLEWVEPEWGLYRRFFPDSSSA